MRSASSSAAHRLRDCSDLDTDNFSNISATFEMLTLSSSTFDEADSSSWLQIAYPADSAVCAILEKEIQAHQWDKSRGDSHDSLLEQRNKGKLGS